MNLSLESKLLGQNQLNRIQILSKILKRSQMVDFNWKWFILIPNFWKCSKIGQFYQLFDLFCLFLIEFCFKATYSWTFNWKLIKNWSILILINQNWLIFIENRSILIKNWLVLIKNLLISVKNWHHHFIGVWFRCQISNQTEFAIPIWICWNSNHKQFDW